MDERQELRSLKRGLKALALLNEMEVISISELARQLSLPRTTAERILMTLASEGYVHRTSEDRRYRLSLKVCALAQGFSDESWISHIAEPLLLAFTERTGWPLAIATPTGAGMTLRLTTYSATSMWLTRRRIGTELPMADSSAGLVHLAFAPDEERCRLTDLIRRSNGGGKGGAIGHEALFTAMTERTREEEYAFDPIGGDREESVAVPILIDGEVRAVLMMMFMTRALRRSAVIGDFVPQLRQLADAIAIRADDQSETIGTDLDRILPRPAPRAALIAAAAA